MVEGVEERIHTSQTHKGPMWENGQRDRLVDSMLRVDHAGEYGAVRICAGQLDVLRWTNPEAARVVEEICIQEQQHLKTFHKMVTDRRVRPTLLQPLWHVGGYLLGVGTALLGKHAAMACHTAVETAISDHYNDQIRDIHAKNMAEDEELRQVLKQFRDDELGHKQVGLDHGAEMAPAYQVLSKVIQMGCSAAIFLSKRV